MKQPSGASILAASCATAVCAGADDALAADGTTAVGYAFLFAVVVVVLGFVGVAVLGHILRGIHRKRLGREPARHDVPPWHWFCISLSPRRSHHHILGADEAEPDVPARKASASQDTLGGGDVGGDFGGGGGGGGGDG